MSESTINDTLRHLRSAFPLQARLQNEKEEIQAVYARILRTWMATGRAPSTHLFPSITVQRLLELDAVVASQTGLGCYPFSARDTGVRVAYENQSTSAMCAIDALAIPALVQDLSVIEARCAHCRQTLVLTVGGQTGRLLSMNPEGIGVRYPKGDGSPRARCSNTLCEGITFLCGACVEPGASDVLAAEDALVVAREFFAFQRQMLTTYASDGSTQDVTP